ncbi:MAG: sigma-70 family RNA polymerase sigma factor [Planctomycetota bacterium]
MHPSPPETRASLILRLRDGRDMAAWEEFTAVYAPVVFHLARKRGFQTADADDLVQEVLVAVAAAVSDWVENENRGTFRAWLFCIARNRAVDFLTRRKYRSLGTGGDQAIHFEGISDNGDVLSDFDLAYRREVFLRASACVRKVVSDSTWQAFWLTSVEDHSAAEVAKRLGQSVGSVYVARTRVMKRLQKIVKQYDELDSNEMR